MFRTKKSKRHHFQTSGAFKLKTYRSSLISISYFLIKFFQVFFHSFPSQITYRQINLWNCKVFIFESMKTQRAGNDRKEKSCTTFVASQNEFGEKYERWWCYLLGLIEIVYWDHFFPNCWESGATPMAATSGRHSTPQPSSPRIRVQPTKRRHQLPES